MAKKEKAKGSIYKSILTLFGVLVIVAIIVVTVIFAWPSPLVSGTSLVKSYSITPMTTQKFTSENASDSVGNLLSVAKWYKGGQPNGVDDGPDTYYFFVTTSSTPGQNNLWYLNNLSAATANPTLIPIDLSKLTEAINPIFVTVLNPIPQEVASIGNNVVAFTSVIGVLDLSGQKMALLDPSNTVTSGTATAATQSDLQPIFPAFAGFKTGATVTYPSILDWSSPNTNPSLGSLIYTDMATLYGLSTSGTKLYRMSFVYTAPASGTGPGTYQIQFTDVLGLGLSSTSQPQSLTAPVSSVAVLAQSLQFYSLYQGSATSTAKPGQMTRINLVNNTESPIPYSGSGSFVPLVAITENAVNAVDSTLVTVQQFTSAFYGVDSNYLYSITVNYN